MSDLPSSSSAASQPCHPTTGRCAGACSRLGAARVESRRSGCPTGACRPDRLGPSCVGRAGRSQGLSRGGRRPIIVIGHSAGGIAARLAMSEVPYRGRAPAWRRPLDASSRWARPTICRVSRTVTATPATTRSNSSTASRPARSSRPRTGYLTVGLEPPGDRRQRRARQADGISSRSSASTRATPATVSCRPAPCTSRAPSR